MRDDKYGNIRMAKSSNILTGVSGEYFAAAELSRLGYIASITLRNTGGVDILCSNSEASKHVSIQVKTTKKSRNSWMLIQRFLGDSSVRQQL